MLRRPLFFIGALAAIVIGIYAAEAQTPATPALPAKPATSAAETELEKNLAAGGVRLTGAEIKTLQVGKTYYFKARNGKLGAFYTAEDGRYASVVVGAQVFYGGWKIVGDTFTYSPNPDSTSPSAVYVVKGTEGIYGHFRVKDGLYADSVVRFKPGNAEQFELPDIKPVQPDKKPVQPDKKPAPPAKKP